MQFITVLIATLAAVASASQTAEKRSCIASEFILNNKHYNLLGTLG